MQPRMGGLIQVNINDRATLQASYMPYILGGGCNYGSSSALECAECMPIIKAKRHSGRDD